MGTTALWYRLKDLGVIFRKEQDVWIARYDGDIAARDVALGECVWKAARNLGEPL